jgi:Flp pilus assembly protein TadD
MRTRSLVAVIAMALVLAACGSSGQSTADAQKEVTANWTTFFNGANPDTAAKVKLLQDATALQAAVAAQETNPTAKAVSANVKSVEILKGDTCKTTGLTSPCAKVTYDIVANGSALLPNATGFAVRQNGKWLVSKTTFCTLVSLQGPKPQGC